MGHHFETPNSTSVPTRPEQSRPAFRFTARSITILLLSLLIVTSTIVFLPSQPVEAAGDPPVVNGLFYGDGDDAKYQLFATSEYGSGLYTYFDALTSKLYVALVVTHNVNDMVCAPKGNSAYTSRAGWGPHRSCKRASDSEFASFTFQCAPNSPNSWAWQQAMGCAVNTSDPDSGWKSDDTCTSSAGEWPDSIQASTSWVANVNTYQTAYPYSSWPHTPAPPWNLYAFGTSLDGGWKSPFIDSAQDDVTQVPGYPTYSTYAQIAQDHSTDLGWEWSMVYEWSLDLGPGGAGCGSEPIYLVTGLSHHSPSKNDDQNDDFPPLEDPIISDWGDLPDSYGTKKGQNGARHYLTANGPHLGQSLQAELDGQPSTYATDDGAEEEEGIVISPKPWTPGATVQIEAIVGGNNGNLVGWVDWNNDGSFSGGEMINFGALADGRHTLDIDVPLDASSASHFYMRFRLYDSTNLPAFSPTGTAIGGEVEDYYHSWNPTAVGLESFTAQAQDGAVQIEWVTATELDTIGFNLYRAESPTGRQIRLNNELIANHSPEGLSGALYTHPDDTAVPGTTYYYWLEIVDFSGSGTTYGPASATAPIAGPDAPKSYRILLPIVGK